MLVKNIEKVILAFSSIAVHTSIGTNATLLDTDNISKLKASGLNEIWISIHSDDTSINDRLTGVEGSFALTLDAIKECISQGITTNINLPVSLHNLHTVFSTLLLLDNLGVNRVKILRITPIGRASAINGFIHISEKDWNELGERITQENFTNINLKMQMYHNASDNKGKCIMYPLKFLNINHDGYIYPCCLLCGCDGKEIGHIHELQTTNFNELAKLYNKRIKTKYNLSKNKIPCLDENYRSCPLYSVNIIPSDINIGNSN